MTEIQSGSCKFACAENVTILSFVNVTDFEVLVWLANHRLMDVDCQYTGCGGTCFPVALGNKTIGLKCTTCKQISKGGCRGFWAKGKLGMVKMVMAVFSVVGGLSYKDVADSIGIDISKNTWTQWVKDEGMVCAEALERNRRDPGQRFEYAQWDETAFGKRKYRKGRRVRKYGVQWGLTAVKVY